MNYIKTKPDISFKDFIEKISEVKEFESTSGKRYKVFFHSNVSFFPATSPPEPVRWPGTLRTTEQRA